MPFARFTNSAPRQRPHAPFGRQVTAIAYALLTVCVLLLASAFAWPQSSADPNQPARQPSPKQVKEDTKHAEQEADRADKAAAEGKINEALAGYTAATRIAPGDLNLRQRAAALRAQVVQKTVGEAETAALDGDIQKATDRLVEALRIDPGNTILAERLAEMKQMQPTYLPRGDASDYELKGAAMVHPQPGKKSVNVRGDAKSAYEQVAGMFGIKATFDPDLPSRNVKLQAEGLDFYTAMQLLGTEARAFYRVVNPTLIFIAADTIEKRKQYAEEVEQTFPVDSTVSPEDLTEMMRVIREITNVTRINMDSKTHSLVLRDSADKVALAGELIKELNQARRDVMLDIELLEVDSTEARNLGITPPSSTQAIPLNSQTLAQLDQATNVTNLLTLISQVFQTQGISASPTDIFPVGGGRSTFLLTMPSATAKFSEALSLVRSGREFWMRAQDGKPATFFAGERFPITLSLLSASLGSTVIGGAVTPTTFARTDFAVGNDPVAVVAQDFNNDQQKDLAVVNQADSSISILINQGSGNFKPTAGSPLKLGSNEQSPSAIASAIFRLTDATHLVQPADLVVANGGSNTVSVLLGSENFDGTFTEATGSPFAVGTRPSAVIIADLNGDGLLDIAVANETDNTISTFQGDGQGNFVPFPKSPFALPAVEKGPIAMASGVFDNSGKPEFAVLSATTQNIGIYQATGDSTFNGTFAELRGSPIGSGTDPVAFAAGDLNADGMADLAVVNQSANAITVLLNDGAGVFTQAAGSPLATASTPAGVAIADFTNSGFGDIAVTNNGSATLGVFAGLGSGTFSQNIQLSVPPGPLAVITADVNGDGLPDAILTATSTSGNFVTVLLDPTQFASGGGNIQTPYPGSEYEDIGLKVKATPVLHDNDEVTLQLEFEIRSLAGTSVNGIPVITNRTLSQTVRLRENQTSIIAGLLDREETHALSGIPGFAALPGLGYAFGTKNKNYSNTELLFLVTPRRMSDRIRATRARYLGAGGGGGSAGAPPAEP